MIKQLLLAPLLLPVALWFATPSQYTLKVPDTGETLTVRLADDSQSRAKGLSDRPVLASNAGMLFIFEQPQQPEFWMKDMRFDLDIIWIDDQQKVVSVSGNVQPETFPGTFSPDVPVRYVLEVNSGYAEASGIDAGDQFDFTFLSETL